MSSVQVSSKKVTFTNNNTKMVTKLQFLARSILQENTPQGCKRVKYIHTVREPQKCSPC